jgi:integrase
MAHVREVPRSGGIAYEARWKDSNGKFKQRTFTVKRDAERFALKVENELADGASTDALVKNAKTFREVAEASMAASASIKPKTREGYERDYRLHIYPVFGNRRVNGITSLEVEAWVAGMQAKMSERTGKPLAASSVHGAYIALSRAFKYAMKHRLITANPCAVIDKPKVPKVERAYLLPAHVRALGAILDETAPHGLILRCAAFTGLREGELAGLRIGDVNLLHKRVHVRRTVARVKGGWRTGTPKTARSRREVPLSGVLVAELAGYLAEHPYATNPDAPLWPGRIPGSQGDSRGIDYDRQFDVASLIRYYFKPALAELGLAGFSWHDLRHFYASALLATKKYDLHEISRWMGHASYATTVDLYGHLLSDDHDMDALDSLMAGDDLAPVVPLRAARG